MEATDRLAALADGVRRAHASAREHQRRTLEHAVDAGDLLREAKALCRHGQWRPWLHERCGMSGRTAQVYMRLARNRAALENRGVSDLGIVGAVVEITKPPITWLAVVALLALLLALALFGGW